MAAEAEPPCSVPALPLHPRPRALHTRCPDPPLDDDDELPRTLDLDLDLNLDALNTMVLA